MQGAVVSGQAGCKGQWLAVRLGAMISGYGSGLPLPTVHSLLQARRCHFSTAFSPRGEGEGGSAFREAMRQAMDSFIYGKI